MAMLPADGACVTDPKSPRPVSGLEKILRGLSVFTMLTIYLACVGWVLLDAAVVTGVIVYG